jgi:hypothetical protein
MAVPNHTYSTNALVFFSALGTENRWFDFPNQSETRIWCVSEHMYILKQLEVNNAKYCCGVILTSVMSTED